MTSVFKRVVAIWEKTQVELHGQYSLQRLQEVAKHMKETSLWEHAAVFLLTPLPCLLLVTLIDSFELEPPEKGVAANYRFWIRVFACSSILTIGELAQLQSMVPILALSAHKITAITLFTSSATLASVIGISCLIGFPVPFTCPISSPVWFSGIVTGFWLFCKETVKSNDQAWKDVKGFLVTLMCRVSLTLVYPMYAYAFASMSATSQPVFVLLLPCLKIAAKNLLNYCMGDLDDMKPECVILNVEIFSSLYVSLCMQKSASPLSTFALVAVDFVLACLSIHDMMPFIRDIKLLLAKMPIPKDKHKHRRTVIEAVVLLIESDATLSKHSSLLFKCRRSTVLAPNHVKSRPRPGFWSKFIVPRTSNKVAQISIVPRSPPSRLLRMESSPATGVEDCRLQGRTPAATSGLQLATGVQSHSRDFHTRPALLDTELGLDERERLELVQKAAKLLYMTEFSALVEYTEVVTPVIYSKSWIICLCSLPSYFLNQPYAYI